MADLEVGGIESILIASIDGPTGFAIDIRADFPQTQFHTCIAHLVRRSVALVSCKHRKQVAAQLRATYRAETVAASEAALAHFAESPEGTRYPTIAPLRRERALRESPSLCRSTARSSPS